MEKNKKIIFLSLIISIIIYVVISIILSIPSHDKYEKTVFIGNSTKINVNDGEISVYNEDAKLDKKDVKIYFKNEFVDGYIISGKGLSDGTENAYGYYDEDGNFLSTNSSVIAHTKDLNINIKEKITVNISNLNEIMEFAESNNIDIHDNVKLNYIEKTILDYDDDGEEEYIYSVGLTRGKNKYDSFVYYKNSENAILIDRIESDFNGAYYKRLIFKELMSFNDDDSYKFVIGKMMSEYGPDHYELYDFDGTKFTKIGGE